MSRFACVLGAFVCAYLGHPSFGSAPLVRGSGVAQAQTAGPKPRPRTKGRKQRLTLDSSPQQATVFWDVVLPNQPADPKAYGVAGYTPLTLTVPRGLVKVIIEQKGFKPLEREMNVRRNEKVVFTLERAPEAGQLDLRAAGDGSATGAEVFIDGVTRGTIPNVFEVNAGRRLVEVKKAGYLPVSEWFELREGELRTRDFTLKRDASGTGSIMVMAEGGEVWLDGERKDTAPTLLTGISPGDHVVELRREGAEPFRQVVKVEEGKQTKVTGAAPVGPTGTVKVLASTEGVDVYLDGRPAGQVPLELAVPAGQHVVEGRKRGFLNAEEVIKLTPGEQMLVRLKLEPNPEGIVRAVLSIKSAEPNAEVFLNGASLGMAPVERKDLEPGKHVVVVRKPGFVDFKREVVLEEGKPLNLVAELQAVSRLKFLSTPPGAQVFIDGEPIPGVTPNARDQVSAGEHQVMMRLPGYIDHRQTIKVEGGKERIVSSDLERVRVGPSREEVYTSKMAASTFGAKALPKGGFAADVGTGYPYLLVGRLLVSAFQKDFLKIDAGVEMKTYFQLFEFNLHGRAQLLEAGPFSAGARAAIGGGPGFNGRNTFSFEVGPVATLSFANRVNFSMHAHYQFYSDRLCPSSTDINRRDVTPRDACVNWTMVRSFQRDNENPRDNRFSGHRFFLGGSLEVAIDRYVSAFAMVDFLPGQFEGRLAFRDDVNSVMFKSDQLVYALMGATLKL